jgi:hypothetical protein
MKMSFRLAFDPSSLRVFRGHLFRFLEVYPPCSGEPAYAP